MLIEKQQFLSQLQKTDSEWEKAISNLNESAFLIVEELVFVEEDSINPESYKKNIALEEVQSNMMYEAIENEMYGTMEDARAYVNSFEPLIANDEKIKLNRSNFCSAEVIVSMNSVYEDLLLVFCDHHKTLISSISNPSTRTIPQFFNDYKKLKNSLPRHIKIGIVGRGLSYGEKSTAISSFNLYSEGPTSSEKTVVEINSEMMANRAENYQKEEQETEIEIEFEYFDPTNEYSIDYFFE